MTDRWPIDRDRKDALTAPKGFFASACHAGIKRSGKPDLAVLVSELPCNAAWVTTQNQIVAAPVLVSLEHLRQTDSDIHGLVLSSGNANAVTGEQGVLDAQEMCHRAATALASRIPQINGNSLAVMSTGVIGVPLPMEKVRANIETLCKSASSSGGGDFAQAMMTTDTFSKYGFVEGRGWSIGGAAKGSGMIHPNMATMLGVLVTDATIEPTVLQKMLTRCVDQSFNRISVDGDTSTNDMVLLLANGASQTEPNHEEFEAALDALCRHLAKQIVRDGEGASKFVTLQINQCRNESEGSIIAKTIATSPLVKTSWFGQDANWGRILAAIGRAGPDIEPSRISLRINDLLVLQHGTPCPFSDEEGKKALAPVDINIEINLGLGFSSVTYWTCDLSHDYVQINSAYRT
jgi:glutamate N-acetyltransferase/amino-acid N-acetyltransferase